MKGTHIVIEQVDDKDKQTAVSGPVFVPTELICLLIVQHWFHAPMVELSSHDKDHMAHKAQIIDRLANKIGHSVITEFQTMKNV